jgi:GNAT superfamily N-acetyltransferase
MLPAIPRAWRRAAEILRWRGPAHFLLLASRELLRPFMYWYAWNIYATDLQEPLNKPYGRGTFNVRIFASDSSRHSHRETARTNLASLGEPLPLDFDARLNRGDALAIVYQGQQPVASGWMTFSSGMELAYGTTWILQPDEGTQYAAFVAPKFRGNGIFSVLNVALNTYAREHGIRRSVGSISVLNSQSLSMAKRLQKKKIMTVLVVRIHGLGWTFRKSFGAPLHSRFVGRPIDFGYASGGRIEIGDNS